MIEVIYKEEKRDDDTQTDFLTPRNIRQIGIPEEQYKIYVEDYVYTFLERIALDSDSRSIAAILLGKVKWKDDITYIFIDGALSVSDREFTSEHPVFSEDTWTGLKKEKEQYFPGKEIVGWFVAEEQLSLEKNDVFLKPHLKYFAGEKILFLKNLEEKDEAVFRYENGFLIKQSGYYIYFEKNKQMQTYMLEHHMEKGEQEKETVSDDAVKSMRKIIRAKKKTKENQTDIFSYIATACIILAIASVGLNVYKNVQIRTEEQKEYTSVMASVETEENQETNPEPTNETAYFKSRPAVEAEDHMEILEKDSAEETEKAGDTDVQEDDNINVLASQDEILKKEETETEKTVPLEEAEETASNPMGTENSIYVIRPGDTLYQISLMKYGSMDMIEEICTINNLEKDDVIYPGQVIELP